MSLEAFMNDKKKPQEEGSEWTIRFELKLEISTDDKTNEFSYAQLVKKKEASPRPQVTENALESVDEDRERAELEAIARKFQEKYDSVDIGGGYDTTDSFVDDSELYEDFVPPSVDTEKGGFYINTGELSFVKTANSNSMDIPISKSIKPKIKKQATLHTPKTILANKKLKRAKQQIVASAQRSNDMLKKKLSNYQSNSKSLLADFNKIAPPSETPIITDDNEAPIVPPEVPMESPTVIKQPPILPTDLSQDLQDKIKQLQESIMRNQEEYGKLSHKDKSNYDEALIQIHNACKDLRMKTKTAVFEYIAHFMGINRASLTNRIKRIMKKNDQGLLDAPLNQLKEAVNAMMTNLLAKYETEMKEYVAQCGPIPIDTSVDDDSACTDELSETSSRMEVDDKKPKRPRKSFQWTPEIKALLSEVVSLKANIELANADKTRSGEDIINKFLEVRVKPLWPKGWIQRRTLYKMTTDVHSKFTNPQPEAKKTKIKKEKGVITIKKEPHNGGQDHSTGAAISRLSPQVKALSLPAAHNPSLSVITNPLSQGPNAVLAGTLSLNNVSAKTLSNSAASPQLPTVNLHNKLHSKVNSKSVEKKVAVSKVTQPQSMIAVSKGTQPHQSMIAVSKVSQPQSMIAVNKGTPQSMIAVSKGMQPHQPMIAVSKVSQPQSMIAVNKGTQPHSMMPDYKINKANKAGMMRGSPKITPPPSKVAKKSHHQGTSVFQSLHPEQVKAFLTQLQGNQQVQLMVPKGPSHAPKPSSITLPTSSKVQYNIVQPPALIYSGEQQSPLQLLSYPVVPASLPKELNDHCYTSPTGTPSPSSSLSTPQLSQNYHVIPNTTPVQNIEYSPDKLGKLPK